MKFNKKSLFMLCLSLIFLLTISASFADDLNENDEVTITDERYVTADVNEDIISESGNEIYISPTGSGEGSLDSPTNWNDAYSKANNGDTIVFLNGTYSGVVKGTIYKSLELKGSGNSTLDSNNQGGFFTISSGVSVTLNGLSLINAETGEKTGNNGEKQPYNGEGGIVNNGFLTVKNCYLASSTGWGTEGGAIHNSGTCYVYDSTFFGNSGKKGGSIYSGENTKLYVYNTLFNKGMSKEGNAIHAKKAYVELHECSIVNSSAKSGMIYIKESTVYIYNSYFFNSRAVDTAAVINVDKNSYVYVYDSAFDKLTATGTKIWTKNENGTGNGGAINVEKGGFISIKNSTFTNCKSQGNGGAIYVQSSGRAVIDNCSFVSNTAGVEGRNIYSYGTVDLKNSILEILNTITTHDINQGQSETIKVTFDDGTNLYNPISVNLLLNNKTVIDTITTNTKSIPLSGLSSGIYTVNLANNDNSNGNYYIYSQKDSSFAVLSSSKLNLDINVEAKQITEGETAVIEVTLSHEINAEVKIIINGKNYTKAANNGKASFEVSDLKAGNYKIDVIYAGDDKYNPKTASGSVNVATSQKPSNPTAENNTDVKPDSNSTGENNNSQSVKSIISDDITRAEKSSYDFEAKFFDNNGNVLANKTVQFVINGNDYFVKTDEFGVARLVNTLGVGVFNINSINPATGEFLIKTATIVDRFSDNKDVKFDYSYSGVYKVKVYADNGQPAGQGESVLVKLNNKNYYLTTDANGFVSLKIKGLLAKTYVLTAEYKGVKVSNKVVVKQILKAKNSKFKRYKVKKYSATLKTSAGKAIKGKKITFKIKGKTYTAKTNKKGVAIIKIKKLTKIGKYKITIKYLKTSIVKSIQIRR